MSTNFAEWLESLKDRIETGVASAIKETTVEAATLMKAKIDSRRRKTKNSVKYRFIDSTHSEVGLFFAQKYAGTKSTTHQNFRRHYRELRPILRERLIRRINDKFQE